MRPPITQSATTMPATQLKSWGRLPMMSSMKLPAMEKAKLQQLMMFWIWVWVRVLVIPAWERIRNRYHSIMSGNGRPWPACSEYGAHDSENPSDADFGMAKQAVIDMYGEHALWQSWLRVCRELKGVTDEIASRRSDVIPVFDSAHLLEHGLWMSNRGWQSPLEPSSAARPSQRQKQPLFTGVEVIPL